MSDTISHADLQRLLRMFGPPLDTVEVTKDSEVLAQANPFRAHIHAIVNVHGTPRIMETEVDLRRFKGPDDIAALVAQLKEALDKYAAQPA